MSEYNDGYSHGRSDLREELKKEPRMTREEFGDVLSLLRWAERKGERPEEIRHELVNFLNDEAKRHGFTDWQDAYQRIGEE